MIAGNNSLCAPFKAIPGIPRQAYGRTGQDAQTAALDTAS